MLDIYLWTPMRRSNLSCSSCWAGSVERCAAAGRLETGDQQTLGSTPRYNKVLLTFNLDTTVDCGRCLMRPQLFIFTLEAGSHNSESEKAFSSCFNLKMGLLSTSCKLSPSCSQQVSCKGEYEAHANRFLFPL